MSDLLPVLTWFHLILTTHGTWLHGDPRGFRSRNHRIHSSGDYKKRPPVGEHAGLFAYHIRRSKGAVVLADDLLPVIGKRIIKKAKQQGFRLLAVSVAPTHAHGLVQIKGGYEDAQAVAASWKQASSHAVRGLLPGRVWGAGGRPIEVLTRSHQVAAFNYILRQDDAWIWDYRDGDPNK